MSKYENIEDKLGLGKHTIRLEPQDVYENGAFVKGQQKTGVTKAGKIFWLYNSPDYKNSQGYRFKVLVFEQKDKLLCDTGVVEVNIIESKNFELDEGGEPIRGEDGKSIRKKKLFFNPVQQGAQLSKQDTNASPKEEPITMEDINDLF